MKNVPECAKKILKGIRQETNNVNCDNVHLKNYGWFLCVCQWTTCGKQTEDFKVVFLHTMAETKQHNCPYLCRAHCRGTLDEKIPEKAQS